MRRRALTRPGRWLVLALTAVLAFGRRADATLDTEGFRIVGVAHASFPISALAVAPDGRLFATVQALGQTMGTTPGTAQIRVYDSYKSNDGSVLDEGRVWATVEGVRATTSEEGLLGIALAPDFAASKLVYVYLTTTDEGVNQHIRLYRENAGGTGDFVATVQTSLEPPTESANRNGGAMTFGVDGCLYTGVGDNGNNNRWNAQLLLGTDPLMSSESSQLCTNVCLGTQLYPDRSVTNNGAVNDAGKILRFTADGSAALAAAPGGPFASQPLAFATGMRNPVALMVHPLTGQLWAADRGDGQMPEVDVVDRGSNFGWPCLEGTNVSSSGAAACLVGHTPDEVYANHPDWRRPLATHAANPVISGLAAYTGLAYPVTYYGDVFYLLRDSARIYRVDLGPPCFLPHPNGIIPIKVHDSDNDRDFSVLYDLNGDGGYETLNTTTLTAIVQGPDPLGREVFYIAAKQGNSSALTEDSVIYRMEWATAFTPWDGDIGRVADRCFTEGVYTGYGTGTAPYGYENPFQRQACRVSTGPCVDQPDGTSCGGGDACHAAGTCQAGVCVAGAALADGTPCLAGADPCDGAGTCQAGECTAGAPPPLDVRSLTGKPAAGSFVLNGSFTPAAAIAPDSSDAVTVELHDGNGTVFTETLPHPGSEPFWRQQRNGWQYRKRGAGVTGIKLRRRPGGSVDVQVRGQHVGMSALDDPALGARFVVGAQCFRAELGARCKVDARRMRCR